MEILKELSFIVTKNKLKSINLLTDKNNRESKLSAFYDALAHNELSSDDEALAFLYPQNLNKPAYSKLKQSLKSHLINTLFLIDTNQNVYTDRQKAYYECNKDWAAVNILLAKSARATSLQLCKKIFRIAQKYEFTELCRNIAGVLRLHYGGREGNEHKYNQYKELYLDFDKQCRYEDEAEVLYTDLIVKYVNNKAAKKGMHEKAAEYLDRINSIMQKVQTYRVQLYAYLINLIIYTSINDHPNTIKACNQMIECFAAKNYSAHTPLQIAYYQKLVCYTQLKQFKEGKQAALSCIDLMEEGTFNWFKYHELYFTLCMFTRQYQEAYRTFNLVVNHKRFRFLTPNILEIWRINEAYLQYLVQVKQLKPDYSAKAVRFNKFRLGKFLNEMPIYSKDKKGVNIAILVIQLLFLIQQKQYNKVIDQMEAVEKYCFRYLRGRETKRSFYFVRMLLTIPSESFHKIAVMRKAASFLKKLEQHPIETAQQTHKMEIIPYEHLWVFAITSLNEQIYHNRTA